MPTTQEILQALSGMQQNAQASVPVTPNNGNPAGANNMPMDNTPAWVRPSPSVGQIDQILQGHTQQGVAVGEPNPATPRPNMPPWLQGYTGPMPGSPEWQAARAAGQHPILDWMRANYGERRGRPGNPITPQRGPLMSDDPRPILPYNGYTR